MREPVAWIVIRVLRRSAIRCGVPDLLIEDVNCAISTTGRRFDAPTGWNRIVEWLKSVQHLKGLTRARTTNPPFCAGSTTIDVQWYRAMRTALLALGIVAAGLLAAWALLDRRVEL